jgi:hypothetical protein
MTTPPILPIFFNHSSIVSLSLSAISIHFLTISFLDYAEGCSLGNIQLSEPTLTAPAKSPTALPDLSGGEGGGGGGGGGDDGGDDNGGGIITTGLALGAIIGIAVGVPCGIILITGLIGLITANRVKNRRKKMLAGYYNLKPNNAY